MRVIVDTVALRRPHTGTVRWITGIVRALSEVPGIEVVAAPGPPRIRHGWIFRPANLALMRWWYEYGIGQMARRSGADVMFMPAGYTARKAPIPQVAAILDVNYLTRRDAYEALFRLYATWAMTRSAREADRVVTISEFSRSEISRYLHTDRDRIAVVYPGLEPPLEGEISRPLDRPYALYVGATDRNKNVGLLLDAWADGSPADLSLAIVGQPGLDHHMVQARAAGLGGRVIVRGRVGQLELEAWYRNASVFLFPSRAEGFGYPPLEAMQRRVPVIASNSTSLPEVLGDAALFHDVDDPAAVRHLVVRLQGDADLRRRQVERGLACAGRYRWENAAKRLASVLEEAMTSRSGGRVAS